MGPGVSSWSVNLLERADTSAVFVAALVNAATTSDEPCSPVQPSVTVLHKDSPAKPTATALVRTNVTVPRGDKTERQEADFAMIKHHLTTLERPPGLSDKAYKGFLRRAAAYFVKGEHLWRRDTQGRHKIVIPFADRYALIRKAHDELGHKGYFSTSRHLADRFYWPALHTDVRWYVDTCHECQTRLVDKVLLPPTLVPPAPLFHKAYLDTMFMEKHGGYIVIVQARCSLTNWVEARMLRTETGETLGRFILEDLFCRWGGLAEIVTDNGTPFVKAVEWLKTRYGIDHIRISPYNSPANGIVERSHRTLRDSLVKACGGNLTQWPKLFPYVLWADRVTVRKSTGMSPFYMAHGVDPLLPFDITEATFLAPPLDSPLSHEELVAIRARQLQKRDSDLKLIHF